jgi:DNA/RNA-binding domain of Phe-tRNA-synthetase-like protein
MIQIAKSLRNEYEIKVSLAEIQGVEVNRRSEALDKLKQEKILEIRERYDLKTLKNVGVIRAYRDFFWKIGIDPTKIRPSSEALVRRALAKNIPSINVAVDCYNLASMETLIAIGAYDADKIKGRLEIRTSCDEKFIGIGGKELITTKQIVLSDEENILSIYPYRDADFTKITEKTKGIMAVSCGVKGIEMGRLKEASKLVLEYITRFCGGSGSIR